MIDIKFTKISPTRSQIQVLYTLLSQRQYPISHTAVPSFEEHSAFVRSNPYRAWYLVQMDSIFSGAFYVSHENTLGINVDCVNCQAVVAKILGYVECSYLPLPELPSVRAGQFSINVSPGNSALLEALDALDKKVLQITYSLH